MRWELLVGEGLDAQRIQRGIAEAVAGRAVLRRFLDLAGVAGRAARD
jgi:hypothetical protein